MNLNFEKAKPLLSLKRWNQQAFIHWLNRITWDYKRTIIVGFTAILLIGFYAIFQIKIDTNSRNLLAEGKAKQDLRAVEVELG